MCAPSHTSRGYSQDLRSHSTHTMPSDFRRRVEVLSAHLSTPPMTGIDMTSLPTFDELPNFADFTGCAWSLWGAEDQLGTVNLLTDEVVKAAAQEEIR